MNKACIQNVSETVFNFDQKDEAFRNSEFQKSRSTRPQERFKARCFLFPKNSEFQDLSTSAMSQICRDMKSVKHFATL